MTTPRLRELVERMRGDEIRPARVERVLADGTYVVDGSRTAISGLDHLRAGASVPVLYQGGRPALILSHRVRRTKGAAIEAGTRVFEELFIAQDPDTGLIEVWFRNADQVTNLGLREQLPADPYEVRWGVNDSSFLITLKALSPRTGFPRRTRFAVCRLDREAGAGFRRGQTASASVERIYDLAEIGFTFAEPTVTWMHPPFVTSLSPQCDPYPVSFPISFALDEVGRDEAKTYLTPAGPLFGNPSLPGAGHDPVPISVTSAPTQAALDSEDHLIVVVSINVRTSSGLTVQCGYSFIVDVTAPAVLLHTVRPFATVPLVGRLFDPSAIPPQETNCGTAPRGPYEVGRTGTNAFAMGFYTQNTIVGSGSEDLTATLLTPGARTSRDLSVVLHWNNRAQGHSALEPNVTFSDPNYHGLSVFRADGGEVGVALRRAGAYDQAGDPVESTQRDWGAGLGHYWYFNPRISTEQEFVLDLGEMAAPVAVPRLTWLDVEESPAVVVMYPDFAYATRFFSPIEFEPQFVRPWDVETGAVITQAEDGQYPPPDGEMEPVVELAELPEGIDDRSNPTGGTAPMDFHVVNDPAVLAPLGRLFPEEDGA